MVDSLLLLEDKIVITDNLGRQLQHSRGRRAWHVIKASI